MTAFKTLAMIQAEWSEERLLQADTELMAWMIVWNATKTSNYISKADLQPLKDKNPDAIILLIAIVHSKETGKLTGIAGNPGSQN